MADQNNQNDPDAQESAFGKLLAAALALKESNPKVFFGGIAGVVALLLLLSLSGGKEEVIETKTKELSPGQTYTVHNPNTYGDTPTTELVSVPGQTAAYDRSEDNEAIICLVPNGTKVKIKDFADAFGKRNLFAQVEVMSGDCVGKIGWTMVANIDE